MFPIVLPSKTKLNMKINHVTLTAKWKWLDKDDTCGICRSPYEACCSSCKMPGDECPLAVAECRHHFHNHCILKWFREQSKANCPLCRFEWKNPPALIFNLTPDEISKPSARRRIPSEIIEIIPKTAIDIFPGDTMSYRSSSPISGFSGHIPGKKWHVGGRQSRQDEDPRRQELNSFPNQIREMQNDANFSPEQLAQMYQQQMVQLQANGQLPQFPMMQSYPYGFNPYLMNGLNSLNGFNSSGSVQGLNHVGAQVQNGQSYNGQSRNGQSYNGQRPDSSKSRSKSLPRKQPRSDVKDVFGGIESGWWSEGQALKNLRRHQQGLLSEAGSNSQYSFNDSTAHSTFSNKRNGDWDDDADVPTAGYSGHVPGIRQYGIGKPFTIAAKEARRIMHNDKDSTQISSSSAHSAAVKAKNSAASLSNQSQSNGNIPLNQSFISTSQNPFAQSYPYGMMPMYMNNMQQMPVPQTSQKP